MVSSDFVNSFQRALSPATASEYSFILWPVNNAKAINNKSCMSALFSFVLTAAKFRLSIKRSAVD